MSFTPPKPSIEPSPGEPLDEKRLREIFKDIQRLQEAIRRDMPDGNSMLALVASLAGARVAFGVDTAEFPGGSRFSTNKSVTHGLGRTPVAVFAQLSQSGELDEVFWAHSYTESTFQVRATNAAGGTPGAGTKRTFAWIAIG